ncbi:3-beta hydroxysteroid dehydrogenase [Nakamurella silvestris]|nr:3-beta hydroxysteroid dehydrogenase [Nakamurella silvestris]
MQIAVAGGTGLLGRLVVAAAADAGHTTVVLSRSTGTDLMTGSGLTAALQGSAAVIDVSNISTLSAKKSINFFATTTGNLLEAGRQAGVAHHIAVSIVGVDRVDYGYYLGKRRQEELLLAGDRPATVLRATQFHEFAQQLLDRFPGPVALVPAMLSQPIAAREVAQALVALVGDAPGGLVPELAGPEELEMTDMVRRVLRSQGSRRRVLKLRLPGAVGRQMATGGLLPTGPGPRGTQTFQDWLATSGMP